MTLNAAMATAAELPVVSLTRDNTRITRSCQIRLPADMVIRDTDGNGVLHIGADNVEIDFASGSALRGASASTPWNELTGIGIRIDGHTNVFLRGARVHGFKCGLVATAADGLRIEGGDFSDNHRQRLRSTPQGEDGSDWLFPHHNDDRKWRDEYGGAVCIERSRRVTIRDIRVRRGQNGILLDRVNDSLIVDNDCSFLSGWGLALWRSCSNVVSRNAFDFCVRGHVEGVYNRGQDSAGILCFEQSSDNVFVGNSATHGGDGFFGFGGREAVGEVWMDRERQRLRQATGEPDVDDLIKVPADVAKDLSSRGCNRNLLRDNDFSYASAHGIEITFSEGNRIIGNRIVENAICGIWGGYSSDTLIQSNRFTGNGGMAYGLERGAINMEHASANTITRNRFENNKCAVHLWWDNDAGLLRLPGVAGNDRGVSGNVIAGNMLVLDAAHPFGTLRGGEKLIGLQLRDDSGGEHLRDNAWFANEVRIDPALGQELALGPGCRVSTNGVPPGTESLEVHPVGRRTPVGARPNLRGRDRIILDEWGPWDHASPLIRHRVAGVGEVRFDLLGFAGLPLVQVLEGEVSTQLESEPPGLQLVLKAPSGVTPWKVRVRRGEFDRVLKGTIVSAEWSVTFFPWTVEVDPREDLAGWRQLATGEGAVHGRVAVLDFPYGGGGPKNLDVAGKLDGPAPGPDHFGMVARTRLKLPAGKWRFKTLSDDGVRVTVDGRPVIENWTWHGPTPNEAMFEQVESGEVDLRVEHFEIDGYAVLRFEIEEVGGDD
jgi:parallel beta-helix repeat protein